MAKNKEESRSELAIRHLVNDILQGATFSVMEAKLNEDVYNIGHQYSKRVAGRLIKQARQRVAQDTKEMMPHLRNDMLARAMDVYTECREVGDRLSAFKALDQVNKICGLYDNSLTLNGNINQTITIDFGFDENDVKEEIDISDETTVQD